MFEGHVDWIRMSFTGCLLKTQKMSTAHKPTWTPAAGRGTGNGAISSSGYLTGGGRWAWLVKCRQFEYALLCKGSSRTFEVENEVGLLFFEN